MGGAFAPVSKQPEFAPVPVVEQIAVLVALNARLFDDVPLERMKEAEQALREAAAKIPAEVIGRLNTADKLSDEDRKTITDLAQEALVSFHPKPKAADKEKT